MTTSPAVVFGLPAYNRPDTLPETLESILAQTYRDFALVIVDDSASEETERVVSPYLVRDGRIRYERNARRLGMVGNWRRAFDLGRRLYPGGRYFAWVSDHDVWHPRWLEVLVDELERDPNVVLAYPVALRTFRNARPAINRTFDTFGITDPGRRLRAASLRMMAGNLVYGLFRTEQLARAGVFRRVLVPDRQVLLALSLLGQFKQVPQLLWYREIQRGFSLHRQRSVLFAGRAPVYTYVPAHLTHAALLLWDFGVLGRGLPEIGRVRVVWYSLLQLLTSIARELRTAWNVLEGWLGRSHRGRAVHRQPTSATVAQPGDRENTAA